jgi:mannose-6-phosphate isomerase-like protein (cupin superfamily)
VVSEVHESTDSIVLTPGERKSISFGGEKATFLISGQDTGGLFAIVEQTLGPGMPYGPLHVHQVEDSFLYVLEGELGVQRGEVVVNVTAESLVALPKGLAHIFWNRGARPARFLEIFWPAGLER